MQLFGTQTGGTELSGKGGGGLASGTKMPLSLRVGGVTMPLSRPLGGGGGGGGVMMTPPSRPTGGEPPASALPEGTTPTTSPPQLMARVRSTTRGEYARIHSSVPDLGRSVRVKCRAVSRGWALCASPLEARPVLRHRASVPTCSTEAVLLLTTSLAGTSTNVARERVPLKCGLAEGHAGDHKDEQRGESWPPGRQTIIRDDSEPRGA